jgi:molybdopterin converting factor small subunit
MAVDVYLPPSLQSLAGGFRQLSTEGGTLGECLTQIIQRYPQLKEAIFGLNQTLNKRLSFYVNTENAHPEILKRVLRDGDTLYIMDILVGG